MIDTSAFSFDLAALHLDPSTDFIAKVPQGITNRKALFGVLGRKLRFPAYFGENWDALSDCLRDLSWMKCRRIVVLHEDLPLSDTKEAATYLEVLFECVRNWKPEDDRELIVVFPSDVHDAIINTIKG